MMLHPPTVFIVASNESFCNELTTLFHSANLKVESYQSAEKFIAAFSVNRTGCILIDLPLPELNSLDLQSVLARRNNHLPIIFLTDSADIAMAVKALKGGAFDFFTKPFDDHILLNTVKQALSSNAKLTEEHPILLSENLIQRLTKREKEILEMIIAGKINKQISQDLNISLSTVEMHRANLMRKMKVKTLAELIKNYFVLNPAGISFHRQLL